jgi:enoyl-CoA hydratase/carnithine racemase
MSTIRVYYRGEKQVDEEYTMKTMSCEIKSGVALVTFTREKAMNSLSADFKHELMLIYEYLKRNDEVRAVVWTGKGRNFSAGADLTNSQLSLDPEIVAGYKHAGKGVWDDDEGATNWRSFSMVAYTFPKPSVAAVNGFAIGGATNMAFLYHDHVIVGESTKFRYPFGLMSLVPEFGSNILLPLQVGMLKAKELLLMAEWITAADAHKLGLVSRIVPDASVVDEAMKVAIFFAEKDPNWFRKTKELMHKPTLDLLKFEDNLKLENEVFRGHMDTGIPFQAMAKYMQDMAAAKKAEKAKQSKL